MAASTPVTSLEVFESRRSLTKEVINALQNENFSKIGICGLGGVGKTRMAKDIRDRAVVEDLFDEVAMAVVTENPDLKKIQDQLASMLGLELEEKNIIDVRGKRLSERLRKGKRVLIILDDVWKELHLGELGIPTRGQSESKGCKVLITSRDEHVCTIMGTEKNFAVKLLSENESWDLFKEKSGVIEEAGDLQLTAMQVSKECGCLPLALVTVGTALKGKGKDEWKDALEQLQSSRVTAIQGMEKDVYSRLRLSYNLLENNQLQRLFMLCCIFPEDSDISVEELVRYAMGLRLFIDLPRVESVRRRVKSLVSQLKSCYLLLASDEDGHVKVHDVVRDFGLKEASNGENTYLVRHDSEVEYWPQSDAIEPYTGISILSKEELVLPAGLVYPLLKFLILSTKGSIQVSECYFAGMKELSLVYLHGQVISFSSETPKKLQFFMNVQTLCLEFCSFISNIGFIEYMQSLEVVSLFGSKKIDILPTEIGQLKNLKLLDLRNAGVRLIMPGVLSSLKKLEDLYMGDYFFGEGVEDRNQGNCASIVELYSLTALRTLQLSISDPKVYIKLKDFHADVLTRFYVDMTPGIDYSHRFSREFSNTLCVYDSFLRVSVGRTLKVFVRRVLKRVEILWLKDVQGMKNLIEESDVDVCLNLREIVVINCDLIEICSGNLPIRSMRVLEEITLNGLPSMIHLWKGQVRHPCFANLKAFSIVDCNSIQSLFSPSMVRCLVQLQKLLISCCGKLVEIVSKDKDEKDGNTKKTEFPKLEIIELYNLQNFKGFIAMSDILGSPSTRGSSLFDKDDVKLSNLSAMTYLWRGQIQPPCFINLKEFTIDECNTIRSLFSPSTVKCLVNLEELKISSCGILEVIISNDDDNDDNARKVYEFPKLKEMELSGLPCLTSFSTVVDIRSSQSSHIRSLFNQEMKLLGNLEELSVDLCPSMETVFDLNKEVASSEEVMFGRLETIWIAELPELKHIWKNVPKQGFHKLTNLSITECDKLTYLFIPSMVKLLVNLQEIEICSCKMMEQVIMMGEDEDPGKSIVFPRLSKLQLGDLERFKSFYEGNNALEFPSLEDVSITFCFEMKYFCSGSVTAPKVNSSIWMGDLNSTIVHRRAEERRIELERARKRIEEENK